MGEWSFRYVRDGPGSVVLDLPRGPVSVKCPLGIPVGMLPQWVYGPGQPGTEASQDVGEFRSSARVLWG